ncbi:FAD dependent oxidoreductase [hydrothermal vent metagenome]|uniref:FAD dependent oxidoreductase n=1 Tax=hydrothermal vent metagenome TaxID=652676 RepID=A0A1W1BLZ1_9ZZZZ
MSAYYDSIIIGAGIAGVSLAHSLRQKNQKVLVLDKKGIASGGSGAAGAFISPKIGKTSSLQMLTNKAFTFSKDFYLRQTPKYFYQTGIFRIPKDKEDASKFPEYEKNNSNTYTNYSSSKLNSLGIHSLYESFYFPEAGDCDAIEVCHALLKNIEIIICEVEKIERKEDKWLVDKYEATNLILATGYENTLVDIAYMGIKGTWGTRADFTSSLDLSVSMHQSISIGENRKGMIKIGASHEHFIKNPQPCEKKETFILKEKAKALIDTSDLHLDKTFCGMRAGARDYFPLVGKIIDVPYMLENYPQIRKGIKVELKYRKNLYILNGLGGRGFVFAPLMAKILSEHIVENTPLESLVSPDRLFFKWCRKLHH